MSFRKQWRTPRRRSPAPAALFLLLTVEAGLALCAIPQAETHGLSYDLTRTGFELLAKNDAAGAEQAFRKALVADSQLAAAHRGLGLALWAQGQKSAAELEFEAATRLNPRDGQAHILLGQAYLADGEEERAESEFKTALELEPRSGEARLALGRLRLTQRKPAQAEEEFRQAIQSVPDFATAYSALAELLISKGRVGEARALLEKAVALDPGDWHSQYLLATLLMDSGGASRALELFDHVEQVRPDFLPAREEKALALLRRGDIHNAETEGEAMVAKNPQAAEGHRIMALVEWKQRDYDTSLAECALALSSEPGSARMLALEALEFWQSNRKKEAQAAFLEAAKAQVGVASADVFCRLVLCNAGDIGMVGEFLRKNRWLLAPPPSP